MLMIYVCDIFNEKFNEVWSEFHINQGSETDQMKFHYKI